MERGYGQGGLCPVPNGQAAWTGAQGGGSRALCLSCERRGDGHSIMQGASADPVLPLRPQKSRWVGGQVTCEKHTGAECQ